MIRILKKFSLIAAGCICLLLSIQQLNAATLPTHSTKIWQEITNVKWSTDQATWGNAEVNAGDLVYFQITIKKDYLGEHYKDLIKVWVDWNGDDVFASGESVYFDSNISTQNYAPGMIGRQGVNLNPDQIVVFESTSGVPFDSEGTFNMLVRTTCSGDLAASSNWSTQWSMSDATFNTRFSPTASYTQGEAEFHKIKVKNPPTPPTPPTPVVPEPSTVLLLISGLIGIAGIARRKK